MVFEDIYLVAKLGRVSRFPRKSLFYAPFNPALHSAVLL
jgi:hypothetical protein